MALCQEPFLTARRRAAITKHLLCALHLLNTQRCAVSRVEKSSVTAQDLKRACARTYALTYHETVGLVSLCRPDARAHTVLQLSRGSLRRVALLLPLH